MPPLTVEIEHPRVDDCEALADLHRKALPPGWPASDFRRYIASSTHRVFIARYGEGVAGLCVVQCLPPEGEILTLAVSESCRRLGVASGVLRAALQQLEKLEVKTVYLEVEATNEPAKQTYAKFGFETFGVRRGYYANSENGDALILRTSLTRP
jgi:ribosomal-protein-alanine N-acetyltransferase